MLILCRSFYVLRNYKLLFMLKYREKNAQYKTAISLANIKPRPSIIEKLNLF